MMIGKGGIGMEKDSTYKNPIPKIEKTAIFCPSGRFKLVNTGIGRRNIVMSVVMFSDAMRTQIGFCGRQWPSSEESQKT